MTLGEKREIRISDKISYIEASENPLSAEIGIIREGGCTWLYDVGCGDSPVACWEESCNVVLSHFHEDHTGSIGSVAADQLYVSRETFTHVLRGTVVTGSIRVGNLHIFPLPSSHTKGCLGLEIDGEYAFVGDALYSRWRNGRYVYNVQLLQEEIAVLKRLQAPLLLVSHFKGMVRRKEEVIAELEEIYRMRVPNDPEIAVS